MTKRTVKLRLSALLVACVMAVTACGQPAEKNESASVKVSETQQSSVVTSEVQEETSYFNATGFPIVNEEITLKVLCCANASSTVDFEDMPGWKYLEELTGIKFEIESYAEKDLYDKMPLIMSDPDAMPDVFLQCGMGSADLLNYGQQGLLIDMTDLIEQYGENIKKCWEVEPLNRSYATSTDGAIYGLPSYNDFGLPNVWTFQVNTRWMENCGITEYPTTIEEFKDMLIAFRDKDANGNGDPNDEIPLIGTSYPSMMQILGNVYNMPIDWPRTGVQYGALYGTTEAIPVFMMDNYRDMISFMNELYEEGLINQDCFSVSGEEDKARRLSDVYGVFSNMTVASAQEKYNPDEWVSIPLLSTEYRENVTDYAYVTPSYQTGMAMISSNTEYPEACIRFLDYLMSVDGTALFVNNYISNLHTGGYDLKAAGVSQEIIDMYQKELAATDGNQQKANANITGCTGCLWLYQFADYAVEGVKNVTNNVATNNALKQSYCGKEFYNPTHTIVFNEEEQEIVSTYKTDLDGYITERITRWIAGEEDLNDETWNAYIVELKKMNVDKLTEAYASAHKRFFGVE